MWAEFVETAANELWWTFESELLDFGSTRCILRCIHVSRTPCFCPTKGT